MPNDTAVLERPTTQGEMRVLDRTGDLKIVWSSDKEVEVEHARKTFDDMIAKGYSAFSVKKDGSPGKRMPTFDPDTEAMILVPRIVGG